MKKLLTIFLLIYYFFGSICLPLGDFSYMGKLSDMYASCAHENPDITPVDFFFEHLLNLEVLIAKFEHHSDATHETPHQPFSVSNHLNPVVLYVTQLPDFNFISTENRTSDIKAEPAHILSEGWSKSIFKPPIAC